MTRLRCTLFNKKLILEGQQFLWQKFLIAYTYNKLVPNNVNKTKIKKKHSVEAFSLFKTSFFTPEVHLELRIYFANFPGMRNNFEEYTVAERKMIHEKHIMSKISSYCPYKMLIIHAISHFCDQKHLKNFDHDDQLHLKELFGDGRARRRREWERWASKTETETGQD